MGGGGRRGRREKGRGGVGNKTQQGSAASGSGPCVPREEGARGNGRKKSPAEAGAGCPLNRGAEEGNSRRPPGKSGGGGRRREGEGPAAGAAASNQCGGEGGLGTCGHRPGRDGTGSSPGSSQPRPRDRSRLLGAFPAPGVRSPEERPPARPRRGRRRSCPAAPQPGGEALLPPPAPRSQA